MGDDELLAAARAAAADAYAPYSGFAVGAAVRTRSGRIHPGANMENASYGLSLCAEAAALARAVAENDAQRKTFELLIAYYQSGDLKKFDEYNIAWVGDTESLVDTVNGFIEVYDDALGMRATYEAVVSYKDPEATKRIAAIADSSRTRSFLSFLNCLNSGSRRRSSSETVEYVKRLVVSATCISARVRAV